ncbi:ErmE/ErmH/ErmO/ErmR family 23S rRNA (adenine(2058)-N(6))-methyltransferase [Streptomyces sp. NPDC000229]|uniref:ErmE/ErmH/ErmO/ErmR family 23S rRNA (adenine(2058)-N(6))-methyltransferase n=1 Tax=Streptomyces sp. NPDC000229 TaxID=3154247 RepID=UPI0033200526
MARTPTRASARTSTPAQPRTHHRRRELSQNFLTTTTAAPARLVRAARPHPNRLLLEVGAGKGALTEVLAPLVRELWAYEIDARLLPGLRTRFAGAAGVRVVGGDFLAARPPREPFAVVGNVPFSRTAAIVDWCLHAPALTDATLITQLEYARKRTGDYGRWSKLTVLHWPWLSWALHGRVGRREFRPVPRVDAGILRIERRARPLLPPGEAAAYRRLVEVGFRGVGGSVHASLCREGYAASRLDRGFRAAGLDRSVVVAHVPPEAWLALHRSLKGSAY